MKYILILLTLGLSACGPTASEVYEKDMHTCKQACAPRGVYYYSGYKCICQLGDRQ